MVEAVRIETSLDEETFSGTVTQTSSLKDTLFESTIAKNGS